MVNPNKDWCYAQPIDMGFNADFSTVLHDAIVKEFTNINGILIVKNEKIIHEQYYDGYTAEDTHRMASVTKSIVSALIGIAIDKGYIESVDEKVLNFFPEYIDVTHSPYKRSITIHHLLTMTATYPFRSGQEPFARIMRQDNWANAILDMLAQNGMNGKFQYTTMGAHLLSVILTKATGMSARAFANKYLFGPLGMRQVPDQDMHGYGIDELFGEHIHDWIKDPQEHSAGGWGLSLSVEDMARFGALYMHDGMWNGTQIVSKKWIEASLAENDNNYGYMWWLYETNNIKGYAALGSGGNAIMYVPKEKLLVAIASKIVNMPRPRYRWELVEKYILPAKMHDVLK